MATELHAAETNLKIGSISHFLIAVDDLDATIARVQEDGVTIVSAPREVPNSGGTRCAFIHNDEQMPVELIQLA